MGHIFFHLQICYTEFTYVISGKEPKSQLFRYPIKITMKLKRNNFKLLIKL